MDYIEDTRHLKQLKENGFNPGLVIDVGISNGEFFNECQKIFNKARYLLFEARKIEETKIAEILPSITVDYKLFFNTLLGKGHEDDVNFYQIDAGSSVYSEKTKFPKNVLKKNVRPMLKFLVEEFTEDRGDIPFPVFLKIDTQGSELDILQGMGPWLDFVEVVQLEVAFQEYNHGAPGVFQIHEFMNSKGFTLYDLGAAFRKQSDNSIFHMDWVFVAKRSELLNDGYFWTEELKHA
ncbi:Methyltransferase FkbM [uncultured Caudovirales phage]|uniref:Methyltransferase FkbM n=1 Tax=uncultured Caudovirales phage TaxID=2100421 RepID=A0A6J5M8T4_9CAUD|nr:Methyltransferase FkbM [uncultured Caudovirales phage]